MKLVLTAAIATLCLAPAVSAQAEQVRQLEQGWTQEQREFFRYASQGTFIMPAPILEALEQDDGSRCMSPDNLRRFGLAFDGANAPGNPYGWPIGFIVDAGSQSGGVPQAGLTCAACHSGQLQYRGERIQIDGGRSNIDLNSFVAALSRALIQTAGDHERRDRLVRRAVLLGYPSDRVDRDLDLLMQATIEAGGRTAAIAVGSTEAGHGRLDAVNDIAISVFSIGLAEPDNIRPGDAPTSYPYIWDIWRFDWVQYNASARQPMARNMVEALGNARGSFVDPVTGDILPEDVRWKTTLHVENLFEIEQTLQSLKPPVWPSELFGTPDETLATSGRQLFAANCAGCHGIQELSGTDEWHVPVVPLDRIGTDANHAINFAGRRYDARKLGVEEPMSTAEGLYAVVVPVKERAYRDAGIPQTEWARYDGFGRTNDYNPSPCGYKARPLVGVWSTGPFLHNGVVPTIYDLLSDERPERFALGRNEFDPVRLGIDTTTAEDAIMLDTSLSGNGNRGHWFTDDAARPGRIGPALSDDERMAIIEYLKVATHDDYPRRVVEAAPAMPCADDPDWAVEAALAKDGAR